MINEERISILNVDDNEAGRYATTRILKQAGFAVTEAATGNDALKLVKDNPDLVVLDVNLPDISGFEVCKRIKENTNTRHIPVLHLSATFVDTSSKVEGLDVGADGYLTQPVEPQVLIATINALLRTKRAEAALKITLQEKNKYITDLKYLMEFSTLMREEMRETELIQHAGLALKKQFQPDVLAIIMIDTATNTLKTVFQDPPIHINSIIGEEVILNPFLCRVIRTGQEFLARDINKDITCRCFNYKIEEGGYLCAPLVIGGTVGGMIIIVKGEKGYWDNEDIISFLSTCIGMISSNLYRVRLMDITFRASITDMLTGIYNRRFFDEMLGKQINLAKRRNERLCLLIADIDHFKNFNDTYGHTIGDIVLQKIARAMRDHIRSSDIIARYGGEEFVIIMPMTDITDALKKADGIRQCVESVNFIDIVPGKSLKITISIGVTDFPEHGADAAALLNSADSALYKAKKGGRNRVEAP